jgi:RNA-splicing ligase RtcB
MTDTDTGFGIELAGEQTTARVLVPDADLVEQQCLEQIQTLIDHPAFTNPVRVMPDTHYGAGAPIGFTMPLGNRVVPNIVGVDVGCGMAATRLGDSLPNNPPDREDCVRDAVPMGQSVHDYEDAPHLINEFPFQRANEVFDQFAAAYKDTFGEEIDPLEFEFTGYDEAYFKSMCRRVLGPQRQSMGHVIKSAGTLGGGNHFIEFAQARETGDYWLIIHSGSRYLGKSVAEYWQHKASQYRQADTIRDAIPEEYTEYLKFDPDAVTDQELHQWVTGGMGESHLRKGHIRADFEGSEIEDVFDTIGNLHTVVGEFNDDLAWLEGREAHGYYVDMLFAQQYARWNRELMSNAICETLGITPEDHFQSIHNYIDFRDLIIRKGATPARDGQRLVVPFNMADGSILARGKGNDTFHQTAPHGAGRVMSRTEAHQTLSLGEFSDTMSDIYSQSVTEETLDEAPMAYKSANAIADAITPTAEIDDWLEVVHNLKATD